jgi:alpha-mannosidase
MEFCDANGNVIPHLLLNSGTEWYWFHDFVTVLLKVTVPACGYTTYTLQKSDSSLTGMVYGEPGEWQQVEVPHEYLLENKNIRAEFDVHTGAVTSIMDKKTGAELLRKGEFCGFRLVYEDTDRGMTAWRVGRHMSIKQFDEVHIKPIRYSGAPLRKAISIDSKWNRSSLSAVIYLDEESTELMFSVNCDWHEKGQPGEKMPQLNFIVPIAAKCKAYKFDVPAGVTRREPVDMDLPGNSFICAVSEESSQGIMLSSDTKYGYRGFDNSVAVNLIRASYDPDPQPEYGMHKIKLSVGVIDSSCNTGLIKKAYSLWHPLNSVASSAHIGELPLSMSFMEIKSGDIALSAVKMPENGERAVIFRVYDTSGNGTEGVISFIQEPKTAVRTDIHEMNEYSSDCKLSINGNDLILGLSKGSFITIKVNF